MFNKNKVKSLQDKSSSIVSVFTKTVNDLTKVNESIVVEVATRDEQLAKITSEKTQLTDQHVANTAIITKLNQFFN